MRTVQDRDGWRSLGEAFVVVDGNRLQKNARKKQYKDIVYSLKLGHVIYIYDRCSNPKDVIAIDPM